MKYCSDKRRFTRVVQVGNVAVGGNNPIRIQSMTTTPTDDVDKTVNQIIHLADSGCEIARVTVQGKKEAYACEGIKNKLVQLGYTIPLVADIHFYPPAAMVVADFVDKVRINPGNFADRRATFRVLEYTDASYAVELEKIEEKFAPLVLKCKELKRAMRIGCNHGSLSDRIMNWYGDTPEGMVESALEFTRVARKYDYHDLIFSMKASNTQVMIQAYRLLTAKLDTLGWNYPLHLGVTEAGEGEDGRVKSAIGIGSLLLDGLGDTIRVSLTEDPHKEIKPCQKLKEIAENYKKVEIEETTRPPFSFERRKGESKFPLHRDGSVGSFIADEKADFVLEKVQTISEMRKQKVNALFSDDMSFKVLKIVDEYEAIKELQPDLILLSFNESRVHKSRAVFDWLKREKIDIPVILNFSYTGDIDSVTLQSSAECGSLFCDGLGDGLLLEGPFNMTSLSFSILQGARMRTTKTEFISCPSCGRTLFDLQEVAARIRERTDHLVGVKIAIMGCIVNGPGEMADAHFGYVGSKPGKIDLYVGKECVERNIDFADGDDKLVALIKKHDMWVDKGAILTLS